MRVRLYSFFVFLVACCAVVALYLREPLPDFRLVLVMGIMALAAESLAFRLQHGGTVSLMFAVAFAAVLLGGPTAGVVVAVAGAAPPADFIERKPAYAMLFNLSQLALGAAGAGTAYQLLGGVLLYQPGVSPPPVTQWIVAALLAAPIYALINLGLVTVAVSLKCGLPLSTVWKSYQAYYVRSLLPLTLLGLVLAQLIAVAGLPYALLLLVPFAVSWRTFRVYQQQEEAYFGTVRSLVAALEAKDPYTRGHAERVAEYAKYVGEAAGLCESEVKKIEWAALLHDIGKIAVSCRTLTKPGTLSEGEYSTLREHPNVAASILQEVGFLEGIVPLVTAHHERIDGTGYPLGLGTNQIPVGARVLAVADVFDAITSERSYRPALDVDAALHELRAVAGTQLDERFVSLLASGITDGAISIDTAWVRPEAGDAHD